MRYKWYKIRKFMFPWLSFLLNLAAALFWVALRINHSGISKFLGADTNPSFLVMNLPVMVTAAAWVTCFIALLGLIQWERRKWPGVIGFILGLIFTGAAVAVVIFGAKDYLRFILPHFWESLAVAVCILAFGLVLYCPIHGKNGLKTAVLVLVILAAVVIGYQLRPCDFSYGAVVYAVEDDYQIVFSTSDSAVAWVEIGGEAYYDLYAGSMRSADRVHKITVPQEVLDEAKSYSIHAKQMIYRGPFGGYTGPEISQSYSFRPVDTSDGLEYFALSDVHEAVDAAASAAQVKFDFIVLIGDLVSMVETEKDAQIANELAHKITKGQVPVVYARGNHEIKGEYAEDLYKYVGTRGQDYYYTATLGEDVFVVVLDLGEDHEDDWWEYYGTAQFDLYRQEQTEFLEELVAEGVYKDYRYRLALCHIPVQHVDNKFEDFKVNWTRLLNIMDIDMCLSGHKHELWPFIPGQMEANTALNSKGYYLTDFNFPGFLVGRRSLTVEGDTQSNGYDQYTGLYVQVDFEAGTQTAYYQNSGHQMLSGEYPFAEGEFRKIELKLKRAK